MPATAPTSPRVSHADPRVQRVIDCFETLAPDGLDRLAEVYSADAAFKDPFNEVRGIPAIRAIFEHMFRTLRAPRFVVREAIAQGDQACLTWDFLFVSPGLGADGQCIRGATHLRFDAQGRVSLHRDYWDAAEELYEKLPLLGALMRWLKKRASS
ncbi:MAG: nuclear transport factor 2 family protein [Leptothrix sp. (in: b-proteobacteria)]